MGFPRFPARRGRIFPASARDGGAGRSASSRKTGGSVGVRLPGRPRDCAPTSSSPPTAARRWSARSACCRSRRSARRWTSSGSGCPRPTDPATRCAARSQTGRMVVLIDRGDYWQCAFLIPKGTARRSRRAASNGFAREVAARLSGHRLVRAIARRRSTICICSSVALDRLTRWSRPGLLAIGDAAHAMSPIGGIGINLAIQDAVAAANILAGPLARGEDVDPLLARCRSAACCRRGSSRPAEARRTGSSAGCCSRAADPQAPLLVRLLDRFPLLRRIPGPDHRPWRPARAGALAGRLRQA